MKKLCQLRISTKTPELTEAHETVNGEPCKGSVRIGFDARLLIDALSPIETEVLAMEFSGKLNPMVVKPIGAEGHICLIMPMLLES